MLVAGFAAYCVLLLVGREQALSEQKERQSMNFAGPLTDAHGTLSHE